MDRKTALRTVAVIICVYLGVTAIQSMADLWRAGDKVTRREQELTQLLRERDELLRQKRESETPFFLERVARDELGMSRPGEKIVVIPQELLTDSERKLVVTDSPNWQKWFRLIF